MSDDTAWEPEPEPEYTPFDPRLPVDTHPWHCTVCGADLPTDLGHRPAACPLCGHNELMARYEVPELYRSKAYGIVARIVERQDEAHAESRALWFGQLDALLQEVADDAVSVMGRRAETNPRQD